MLVVPAIDLLGDDAVRLRQGSFAHVAVRRPWGQHLDAILERDPPLLHVVDLDGARSGAVRIELVAELIERARPVPVQVSGGIRSLVAARGVLAAGATRVVIGTAAFATTDSLLTLVDELGAALVVAVDVRDNVVVTHGWTAQALDLDAALQRCLDSRVARVLCTAVDRDGMDGGPDIALLERVSAAGIPVMAAGGIRSPDDIERVATAGCEAAIVGTALFNASSPALRV